MEPVKLTPAWEDNNLSDDELNFKNLSMEQANLEMNPPEDKFYLVYFTLLLHGIGTLLPWNMFITARAVIFCRYKLSEQYTGVSSDYGTYFLSYVGFAAQIPNLTFSWLNIIVPLGGNLTIRIMWSILIEVVMFVITVILAMVDSSKWPDVFFWTTIFTVVIVNMANGIYQNTIYGIAARLPIKYSGAIVLGANISGTFVAIIDLLAIVLAPSTKTAAVYYFITALFVLLACFDTFFALPLNRFYRYHEYLKKKSELINKRRNQGKTKIPYWYVFKKAFPQLFNVFFVFFVTLSIFPATHAAIKKSDPDFFVQDKYYESVMCFLTFNVTAMAGSLLSGWVRWPRPKYLVIPVALRALFIPFFLFCNFQPSESSRVLPVLINNDWAFWFAGLTMGFTSGYFSSLGVMYTSGTVEPALAPTAGMFVGAMLLTGIFCGILFSMVLPWLAQNVSM
ncbi:equilibrative nucleoside transporter, putative [Pediculus humanus corporis]|uniref:Equilibrative nucleoside transporter, putative n=1 Tax=Pediculus humanus subsp. corporis TaxID=121224 RepID=E0W0A7_PEDHC|nr:equilibrative nucleoside transporter, putative [Pediculus humanus corporis]EEB19063.1 equilibrative nucleoside transporter, putative [Pediculus humanus corporis]